jgi:DNA-binding CsgD family transcriptional regulator
MRDAEALVALGRVDEATAVLQPYEQRSRALHRHGALGLAERVRGLIESASGRLHTATALLTSSVAHSRQAGQVLDAARTQMDVRRVLRRARDRRGARASFEEARSAFAAAGAPGWLAKADDELQHLGIRRRSTDLTTTESAIAEMAMQGLTNAQIAQQLGLNRRTIEANLSRVYTKLAISSRTQLASRPEKP